MLLRTVFAMALLFFMMSSSAGAAEAGRSSQAVESYIRSLEELGAAIKSIRKDGDTLLDKLRAEKKIPLDDLERIIKLHRHMQRENASPPPAAKPGHGKSTWPNARPGNGPKRAPTSATIPAREATAPR